MAVAVKDAKHEQWHGWGVLSAAAAKGCTDQGAVKWAANENLKLKNNFMRVLNFKLWMQIYVHPLIIVFFLNFS